jgi:hypothetical protein
MKPMANTDESKLECATYSILEAGRILGLGSNAAYSAVRNGTLPTIKFNARMMRVSKQVLQRMLEGRE